MAKLDWIWDCPHAQDFVDATARVRCHACDEATQWTLDLWGALMSSAPAQPSEAARALIDTLGPQRALEISEKVVAILEMGLE